MLTPYFAFTAAAGKLSNVHKPSSARAARPARLMAAKAAPAMNSERDMTLLPSGWRVSTTLRQVLLAERRSGRLDLHHDSHTAPAAGCFDRLNAVDLPDTLLQGIKVRNFIFFTTIMSLKHDSVSRQRVAGPPAGACWLASVNSTWWGRSIAVDLKTGGADGRAAPDHSNWLRERP